MKKSKIIVLNLLIISYLVTVGVWMFSEGVVFLIPFGVFSLLLVIFMVLAMMGGGKPRPDTEDTENEEEFTELRERLEGEDASGESVPFENLSEEAQFSAGTPAGDEADSAALDETITESETVAYMEQIDELKGQLAELQSHLDEANAELVTLRRNAGKDEAALSILPQDITPREMLSTINIVDIANSVAEELRTAALRAGLRVQVSSGDDVILVRADENLLRVLFRNIVDNSIKYMNRQGMLVITLSVIGDDLFVVLKDNGEGLSAEETGHIFELNYQGSNRISGNGLGLAQAKAVVEYYGGNIYAKSTPGGGMGIYIQLPTS